MGSQSAFGLASAKASARQVRLGTNQPILDRIPRKSPGMTEFGESGVRLFRLHTRVAAGAAGWRDNRHFAVRARRGGMHFGVDA